MDEHRRDVDAFALEQLCVRRFQRIGGDQPFTEAEPDPKVFADVLVVDSVDLRIRDRSARIGEQPVVQRELGIA